MKKVKIFAVLTAVIMLCGVYFSTAYAFGDALGALGEYFGISANNSNSGNSDDPSSYGTPQINADSSFSDIANALQGVLGSVLSSEQVKSILNSFDVDDILGGDSDVINEVMELIGANSPTDSGNSGNSGNSGYSGNSGNSGSSQTIYTTVPQYNTDTYVTSADTATYVYNGATSAVTTTMFGTVTTGVGETTSLSFIAPSTVYAELISTTLYDYSVNNTEPQEKEGMTLKMIIGIAILLISGVAVVGVALSLKKSRV